MILIIIGIMSCVILILVILYLECQIRGIDDKKMFKCSYCSLTFPSLALVYYHENYMCDRREINE